MELPDEWLLAVELPDKSLRAAASVGAGNWVEERALIESAPGMCIPVRLGTHLQLFILCEGVAESCAEGW